MTYTVNKFQNHMEPYVFIELRSRSGIVDHMVAYDCAATACARFAPVATVTRWRVGSKTSAPADVSEEDDQSMAFTLDINGQTYEVDA